MKQTIENASGVALPVYTVNTAVVGSGAAGFNAASRLWQYGQTDIALVTEGVNAGTSRNTGSDKQTYYKLSLSGDDPDSVREMAQTLFDGECVDGDTALCEAALSAPSFLRLTELGVPFPQNRYGEYVGYKTDHDPRRRATSVGPYTSRRMTECLETDVRAKGVPILDGLQVIRVLSDGARVSGLLCLNLKKLAEPEERFAAIRCKNVVWCTGGPAGLYLNSVYPFGQYGATGLALEAGAEGQNLTEWQYGLASVKPRWNVSGTYMQALPRFLSTDASGEDQREFLRDFFTDEGELLSKVFLKGYQWPFDVRKVDGGSSIIDILVYLEGKKGRRVFLDYRQNPGGHEVDFARLSAEARQYLEKAGACFGAPIDRLRHMNAPAVAFYKERGVDLETEPLEIALCAQHNNGGLAVDCWWQTSVEGFFCAGEAAGAHGVYRPGGSALNAGQAGSTRAARFIAARRQGQPENDGFAAALPAALAQAQKLCQGALERGAAGKPRPSAAPAEKDEKACSPALPGDSGTIDGWNAVSLWRKAQGWMSEYGSAIREEKGLATALTKAEALSAALDTALSADNPAQLPAAFRLRETLLCQRVYLGAMLNYLRQGGGSRGSALYTDPAGKKPYFALPDAFTFRLDGGALKDRVQVARRGADGGWEYVWRQTRPIPQDDDFFENVWRTYREDGNIR